jgi:hypothetical protein
LVTPRILRQLIASVLVALLASPAWSQSQVAGTVIVSQAATMRNSALLPGSTVFSGESISVSATGSAQIALGGGGRIEVLHDSAVQLNRNAAGIEFVVQRGGVSFSSGPKDAVETTLGDASIRTTDPLAIGLIHVENPDSAVLAAIKGKLAIKTAHDLKTTEVPEGSAVRITLVDAPASQRDQGAEPAGRAAPAIGKIALIAFLVGALFLGVFLWIAAHEPTETNQQLATETSPFRVQ